MPAIAFGGVQPVENASLSLRLAAILFPQASLANPVDVAGSSDADPEVLAAALTGGETTRPAHLKYQHAVWNNMLAIVFDPARLGSSATLGHEVQAFIDWVRSAECQPGVPGIAVPGEPEQAMRRARAQAIPLDAATLAELDRAAAQVQAARGSGPGPLSALVQTGS